MIGSQAALVWSSGRIVPPGHVADRCEIESNHPRPCSHPCAGLRDLGGGLFIRSPVGERSLREVSRQPRLSSVGGPLVNRDTAWRLFQEGQETSLIIDGNRVDGVLVKGMNEAFQRGRDVPTTITLVMPTRIGERTKYLTIPLDRVDPAS